MFKIIDFEQKGNVVRFYLGDSDCEDYWGDDWNDAPYDCNASRVYDRYIKGQIDLAFPFDSLVLQPCDGERDCGFTKKDMMERKVPCIIVVPYSVHKSSWSYYGFNNWVGSDKITKYYFGDLIPEEGCVPFELARL